MNSGNQIVAALHAVPTARLMRVLLAYFHDHGRRALSPGKVRWLRRVSRRSSGLSLID